MTEVEPTDMSEETADALMRQYKATGDFAVRNQLVMHYSKYIHASINSMRSILLSNIPYEDFFNQGVLALMDGIEKYEQNRGASFNTFVYKSVRGALLNYLRHQNWLPNRVRDARREIKKAGQALQGELMREPTDAEIAAYLGMTEQKLSRTMVEIASADSVSLEEMLEESTLPLGIVTAQDSGIDQEMMRTELMEVLARAISALNTKQRQVITMCYYENLNLREMGEVLGLTQQRVSQIRFSALEQLKAALSKYNSDDGSSPLAELHEK